MSTSFVHLHVHTEYSLVDGIARIRPLVEAAARAAMPAVAVTEQANLFSMVKFYRAAITVGVKPILGVDFALHNEADPGQPHRLLLLAQDAGGYRNLSRLVSRSYIEGNTGPGREIERQWLDGMTGGLIALNGGPRGDIGYCIAAGRTADARDRAAHWAELFADRFYLQVQRTDRPGEERYLDAAVDIAAHLDLPVVATNDVRFLAPDDFEAHEARVCIHHRRVLADKRRPRDHSRAQYLRTPAEMAELFADLPGAVENSVEIARRCNLELELGSTYLPDFPVPEGYALEDWLREQSRDGLRWRLETKPPPPDDAELSEAAYRERLAIELGVINQMGFPGYFLIVADFIRWARENGVPVGPGRGSGAGSLVAYALGITDLDPLRHDLLFERFLNPERVSLPDFDIDFCMDGRDRVIEYVAARYAGADEREPRVSQIITFGTMAAKAVVRDVGRVLGHPYGFVDQLAKLIPFELGITLDTALDEEALRARYDGEEEVRAIIDLARKLEGITRNAGKHAGGVVIAPSALTDFTPLYCEPGATGIVTQLDKDDVESIGLVKFDFLGLRTLTIIDRAVATINAERERRGEALLDMAALPIEDPASYDLIKRAATTAVFQLESRGMKELIRRLLPDCFDDVVALVALFRPGPLQSGMVDDFIDRKHGRATVVYPHHELESILKPTYGVILYQEQVMQIAQVLAGYSLGGADLLRRAMGKKKPEEMAKQRATFLAGAEGRGVDAALANSIFDLMEKFAGYGFNKSHSAAYALLSFQTAWLKAHYPAAFMAAVLSADMDNTDKVVTLIDECRTLALEVLPPDINACQYAFAVAGDAAVRYGLGAVKGAGESAIAGLIEEREANGPYTDLFDFCQRIDTRKTNRRVVEALIRSGALDPIGDSRARLMTSLTYALQVAEQHARDESAGQNDMFGGALDAGASSPRPVLAPARDWSEIERLAGEKETLGLYLTGHPITRYESELSQIVSGRLNELRPESGKTQLTAGLVIGVRALNSRKGRMAVLTLDDRTGRMDVVVYSDAFARHRELLVKDRLLVVEGEVSSDDFSGGVSMSAERIYDLDSAREARAKRLAVRVCDERMKNGFIEHLAETLRSYRAGRTPICIDYVSESASAQVRMALGDEWRVRPSDELLARLRELTDGDSVDIQYQ